MILRWVFQGFPGRGIKWEWAKVVIVWGWWAVNEVLKEALKVNGHLINELFTQIGRLLSLKKIIYAEFSKANSKKIFADLQSYLFRK